MNRQLKNLLFSLAIISGYVFAADNQLLEGKFGKYLYSTGQVVESEQELKLSVVEQNGKISGFFGMLGKFGAEKDSQRVKFTLNERTFDSIKDRTKPFILIVNYNRYQVSYIRDDNNECRPLKMSAEFLACQKDDSIDRQHGCTLEKIGNNYFCRITSYAFDFPLNINNPELLKTNLPNNQALFIKIDGREDDQEGIGFFYKSPFLITSINFIDNPETQEEIKSILSQLKIFFYNHSNFLARSVIGIIIIGGVIKLLMAK